MKRHISGILIWTPAALVVVSGLALVVVPPLGWVCGGLALAAAIIVEAHK